MKIRVIKFGGREYEVREVRIILAERYMDHGPMAIVLPFNLVNAVSDLFFNGKELKND